jgi:hypothetical protein
VKRKLKILHLVANQLQVFGASSRENVWKSCWSLALVHVLGPHEFSTPVMEIILQIGAVNPEVECVSMLPFPGRKPCPSVPSRSGCQVWKDVVVA